MITDLELTEKQLGRLAGHIEDIYLADQIEVTGLEINSTQNEGDCFKVFFSYENVACALRRDSIYFTAALVADDVTDFEEVHFEKR
jgi:hypothetical protein